MSPAEDTQTDSAAPSAPNPTQAAVARFWAQAEALAPLAQANDWPQLAREAKKASDKLIKALGLDLAREIASKTWPWTRAQGQCEDAGLPALGALSAFWRLESDEDLEELISVGYHPIAAMIFPDRFALAQLNELFSRPLHFTHASLGLGVAAAAQSDRPKLLLAYIQALETRGLPLLPAVSICWVSQGPLPIITDRGEGSRAAARPGSEAPTLAIFNGKCRPLDLLEIALLCGARKCLPMLRARFDLPDPEELSQILTGLGALSQWEPERVELARRRLKSGLRIAQGLPGPSAAQSAPIEAPNPDERAAPEAELAAAARERL